MEPTGRMFLCDRCRVQVVVCSPCDRGQRYCTGGCAKEARRTSVRDAGRRYQSSRRGRFKHAERTRRYRLRQQNVTHQGSMPPAPCDLLASNSGLDQEPALAGPPATPPAWHCHFCGVRCPELVRQTFLHSSRVPSTHRPERRGTYFGHLP